MEANVAGVERYVAGLPRGWKKPVWDYRGNVAVFEFFVAPP